MLPVTLLQLSSPIFCSFLRKTHSCLLHVTHYWYRSKMLPTDGKMSRSPDRFSDTRKKGRGWARSKIQVLTAVLPGNRYLCTRHLARVSISASENAYLGHEDQMREREKNFFKHCSIPVANETALLRTVHKTLPSETSGQSPCIQTLTRHPNDLNRHRSYALTSSKATKS